MLQLEGFEDLTSPNYVCRLRKILYGHRLAPRAWFEKLRIVLLQWGFNNSQVDSSLFFIRKNTNILLLLVYVDDILISGDSSMDIQQLIDDLHHYFALKYLGHILYFLGFEVCQ